MNINIKFQIPIINNPYTIFTKNNLRYFQQLNESARMIQSRYKRNGWFASR